MSWKAVEMQVALPRTQDAGRIQEQIQQRGQFLQDVISRAQLQSEQAQRQTVSHLDEGHKLDNEQREKEKDKARLKKNLTKQKESDQRLKVKHPYLGTKIDING